MTKKERQDAREKFSPAMFAAKEILLMALDEIEARGGALSQAKAMLTAYAFGLLKPGERMDEFYRLTDQIAALLEEPPRDGS